MGALDANSRQKLQAVFRKVIKQNLLPANHASFSEICDAADAKLFSAVLKNPNHVLAQLLPPIYKTKYNLRPRAHNREIPDAKSCTMRKTFITRMLYLSI